MLPATSVIIPCYNGEQYLPAALESVRKQTAPVREIIVVDDGSKVPLWAPEGWDGPPLRIVRTANQGLAAARNVALEHATGEFIAPLDSDDLWESGKIEKQEKALRADAVAVACYTRCVRAPGFFEFGPYPPSEVSEDEFLLVLWYNNFFPPSSVLIRRTALDSVGPFQADMGNGEDIELWLRLLTRGRILQVAEPLCWYRLHDGQFTKNVYRKMMGSKCARRVMIQLHADRLIRAGLQANKLWDAHRNELLLLYYRRQFEVARPLLWDYWKEHPSDLGVLCRTALSLLPASLMSRLRGRLESAPLVEEGDGKSEVHGAGWARLVRQLAPVLRPELNSNLGKILLT